MTSRAYHDSLFISRIAPVAMLFIPCRNGYSHRPMSMLRQKISPGERWCLPKRWRICQPDFSAHFARRPPKRAFSGRTRDGRFAIRPVFDKIPYDRSPTVSAAFRAGRYAE